MSGPFLSFKHAFKGDILLPSHKEYPAAIARWAVNAQRDAAIVAFVKDALDTALAITYARDNNLPIAIRGGGHNAAGASSITGGLVIDLSRYLAQVRVDPIKKLAYVGGGALWESVDRAAHKHGLATVGGTVNHTGVGGLTLGGGIGWLSGRHGLVIDNLVQMTVVVADGTTHTVTSTENPDLFWALRGGGCNFGPVTEFVYRLHDQRPTIYAGPVIYAPDKLDLLTEQIEKWWRAGPGPDESVVQVYTRGPGGEPCIVNNLFFNGSEEEGRANFQAFTDIGPIADMTRMIPYEETNSLLNNFSRHGRGVYLKGVFQAAPNLNTNRAVFKRVIELSASREFDVNVIFEYFTLSKINAAHPDSAAFCRSPYGNVLTLIAWDGDAPGKTERAREMAHELSGIIVAGQPEVKENNGYGNYDLGNEPVPVPVGTDVVLPQDKAKALFGEHYERLQVLKKKYDPEVLFDKWFVITPA